MNDKLTLSTEEICNCPGCKKGCMYVAYDKETNRIFHMQPDSPVDSDENDDETRLMRIPCKNSEAILKYISESKLKVIPSIESNNFTSSLFTDPPFSLFLNQLRTQNQVWFGCISLVFEFVPDFKDMVELFNLKNSEGKCIANAINGQDIEILLDYCESKNIEVSKDSFKRIMNSLNSNGLDIMNYYREAINIYNTPRAVKLLKDLKEAYDEYYQQ